MRSKIRKNALLDVFALLFDGLRDLVEIVVDVLGDGVDLHRILLTFSFNVAVDMEIEEINALAQLPDLFRHFQQLVHLREWVVALALRLGGSVDVLSQA